MSLGEYEIQIFKAMTIAKLKHTVILWKYKIMLVIRDYTLIKKIGQGSFGETYKAFDMNKGENVAVKIVDVKKVSNVQSLLDEINILKAISSQDNCDPAISCYYDSFRDIWMGAERMFIIMEYIEGMTLRDYISMQSIIGKKLLWSIFYGLSKGLNYIHSHGIAHRDIKPENIMITPDGNIKYIDFGVSCVSKCIELNCLNICKGTAAGTIPYIAPEFIKAAYNKETYDQVGISKLEAAKRGDMWAMGLVMFELANIKETFPFPVDPNMRKQLDIMMTYPLQHSNYDQDDNINNIVDSLVQENPASRLTSEELLIHVSNMIITTNLFN